MAAFLGAGISVTEAATHGQFWKYREGDSPRDVYGNFIWLDALTAREKKRGDKTEEGPAGTGTTEEEEGWTPFEFPGRPPLSGKYKHVWFTTEIPASDAEENTLFFVTVDQSFRVWMDDKPIYRYGTLAHKEAGYGWRWHFIPLPERGKSCRLTFQFYSDSPDSLGLLSQFSIDTAGRQFQNLVHNDLPFLINIPLVCFLLVIMVVFCLNQQRLRQLYYHVIAFLTAFGFWMFSVSNMAVFVLDNPAFWWHLAQELVYLIPIIGTRIVWHLLRDTRDTWARRICYGYIAIMMVAVVKEVVFQNGLTELLPMLFGYMVITQGIILTWLFQGARKGVPYCRAFLVPAAVIPALAALDGFSRAYGWLFGITSLTAWGSMAFAVFVVSILKDQFKRERELITLAESLKLEIDSAVELSEIDPLTKSFNRRKFDLTVEQMVNDAQTKGKPLTVLMLDIDFFKRVNDTYGHDIGDRTLIGFVETIRRRLKWNQTIYRWGGEEFMVICQDIGLEAGRALGEKLRKAVAGSTICAGQRVTCSVGVASWRDGEGKDSFFQRLDKTLYSAKQTGRNRVVTETMIDE